MKLGSPRLWISLCSLIIVFLAAVVDSERAAPGPLSTVHGRIPELSGSNSCSECHGGWFSNMTEGCTQCHENTQLDIDTSDGLHGSLERDDAMACARCHSEHHGPTFQMVNAQTFARSGIDDPENFDHVLVGFAMDGAHEDLSCTKCHEHADDDVLPEGAFRFGGLSQRCDTCHEPAHEERLSNNCAECHDQSDFSQPNPAGHDQQLPLIGGHSALSCRDCHDVTGENRLGVRAAVKRSCSDCHDSPHDNEFEQSFAASAQGNSCSECHEETHTSFAEGRGVFTAEQHRGTGFPLDDPHQGVSCESCHGDVELPFEQRFPGRQRESCQQCHGDPHGGQFNDRIPAEFAALEQPCMSCHQRSGFEPTMFDATRHQDTNFPLTGRHLDTECSACHSAPADSDIRRFANTASRCDSCHEDTHRGAFADAHDCSQCHDSTSFRRSSEANFDHGQWTNFALQGAHTQASCESCHPRSTHGDDQGRSFGRIADHVDSPKSCGSCHGNPHGQLYLGESSPAEVSGRKGCLRCHTVSSFRVLQDDYDHGQWNGFDLVGHHAASDCSSCHQDPSSASTFAAGHANLPRPRGTGCVDCHTSPHAGQFGSGEAASCERCHAGATGFDDLLFDHNRDSRFPLTDTHATLSCDACHDSVSANGFDIVRYLPLPTECVDCHGIHEDVLMLRRNGSR